MKPKIDYTLYLVTDRHMTDHFEETVEKAIRGGCTLVQLREKGIDSGTFYARARALKQITDRYGVPLIINDRVDIMLAVDAAGVHVGQSDLPADAARRLIGPEKILGVSAGNVEEARKAEADGADYLGVGAIFPTGTKRDADPTSIGELTRICRAVQIPVVAIGGIRSEVLPKLAGSGITGAAVVSAIMAQKNPEEAARLLKQSLTAIL